MPTTTVGTRKKLFEVGARLGMVNATSYRPVLLERARAVEVQRLRLASIRRTYD